MLIPAGVLSFTLEELTNWLRYEAGSSKPEYFQAVAEGNLKLQQVPEEYARLLSLLRDSRAESYLELGIGNGGSFAMACFMMQETLRRATAVDCLAYRDLNIGQCEEEIEGFIAFVNSLSRAGGSGGRPASDIRASFSNRTTDAFFEEVPEDASWDVIFIDADHSYEGARRDFGNAHRHIHEGGLIVFHDIASEACPGIVQIWEEIRAQTKRAGSPERCVEFIHGERCGIGVLRY